MEMEKTRYKLLLIEDDKLDLKAFTRAIRDENLPYDCVVAESVSQATNLLKTEQFDVVVSDYLLGDGTAFDFLELARNIPTILVTGTGDEQVALKAWKAGADDYLTKDPGRNYLKVVPITVQNAIKHRRTEAKLQLLSGAIMSADDGIYITDAEDKIIFVNKAFREIYGYTEEEIINKESSIIWTEKSPDKDVRRIFRTLRGVREVGFYHKRKDGSEFLVSHSRSTIKDKDGNYAGVIGICRDISQSLFVEDKVLVLNRKN